MTSRLSVLGEWKSDSAVRECEICGAKFNFSCRRHHCRYCGGIFCASCSSAFVILHNLHKTKGRRVCRTCLALLSKAPPHANHRCDDTPTQKLQSADVNACACESDPLTAQSSEATSVTFATSRYREIPRVTDRVALEEAIDDVGSDNEDVSTAVAGVYSSVDDGQRTSGLAFLAALQENLRYSEDADVLHVLLYVSSTRYQVILVTVSEGETMLMLASRLLETYFRLDNGPFKSLSTPERDILLHKLRFSSESVLIDSDANATDVAVYCKHLVLSTLSISDLRQWHDENLIQEFFRSELCDEHKEDMIC
ncbi:putative zinc finger protein [Trypanosoma rangeli]|uniref:Putative zinc finger protein n=1 Tax=Trypanosoma rangeli TaxID=5698 RepID=A0A3R7N484_TRYRA|nr:putative zinc finger protein [Trypanosoma rangeli]RNE99877.1 putative zinc finger protein [Trypanosoma rangeli]|eukprot:RNE99877.1 putative zinc finger protein [Trypanosoma rangeli]